MLALHAVEPFGPIMRIAGTMFRDPKVIVLLRTVLFTMLLFPALMAEAQRWKPRTWIGVKGGFMRTGPDADMMRYTPGLGGTLGLYVPRKVDSKVELQPELLLTTHGFIAEPPEADAIGQRTFYVQLPVVVKLYTDRHLNFQLGGVGGALVHATSNTADGAVNATEGFNSVDFGLLGGIGLDLRRGTDIALRFQYGITPVLANDQDFFPRYRSLQVTVGKRIKRFKPSPRRRR